MERLKLCRICGGPESDESHWTLVLMPGGHRFVEALCVCLPDPNCPYHRILAARHEVEA